MKRFLLSVGALSLMLGASAASKRIASIVESSYGSDYNTVFTYDESGRLATVTDDYSKYTFDYSQLASNKLVLIRVDSEETTKYDMTLDEAGRVVKVEEYYNGELDEDYMTFEYADGRLVNFKQIRPDEVEESIIAYNADGSVAKIENKEDSESECETVTFEYGDLSSVEGISLWDTIYCVDLDDIEYVSMAGFLGVVPAQLPVKVTRTDIYGSGSDTCKWTVDSEGYADSLTVESEYSSESYKFVWEVNSGVGAVLSDKNGATRWYSVDGVEVDSQAKGIVIERRADGSVVKRINR